MLFWVWLRACLAACLTNVAACAATARRRGFRAKAHTARARATTPWTACAVTYHRRRAAQIVCEIRHPWLRSRATTPRVGAPTPWRSRVRRASRASPRRRVVAPAVPAAPPRRRNSDVSSPRRRAARGARALRGRRARCTAAVAPPRVAAARSTRATPWKTSRRCPAGRRTTA